jgi:AbrB family looped-hinge helix DNA binding protein
MAEATLSSRNQAVIPSGVGKALGIKPGDKLLLVVRENHLIVMPKSKSFAKALKGIARAFIRRNIFKRNAIVGNKSGLDDLL